MSNNDEELYSQLTVNPEKAFRAIYERYSSPLFRYIYRFTANSEAAEEILHDIFLQLLGGKYTQTSNASLKSWLYTLAKNKSINQLKKNSFEIKSTVIVDNTVSDFDLAAFTINKNLLQKLTFTEGKLPIDLKQTWELKKQGLDHQQIATKLSIPVGTVKSRFFRLVEHLRKEFENEQAN